MSVQRGVTWADVCAVGLDLPAVEENTSYGTPALKVKGKLLVRLLDDEESVVLKVDFDERSALVGSDPESFVVPPHYRNYPMVVVRLTSVDRAELRELLAESWRRSAPPRLVADYDARRS